MKTEKEFDAIVVGSGISGGWAAKELSEKGLKTLVIERGRNIEHIKDYKTAMKPPWEFQFRLKNSNAVLKENPVQSQCSVYDESNSHLFVNDSEHPYIQEKPFNWIRGYQVGGRSLTWGRQCYRLSDHNFEGNKRDGVAIDWPVRYRDIEPWYDYVEKFVGISGKNEGLAHLPDGSFLPPIQMNCVEGHFASKVNNSFRNRRVIHGRTANLTVQHMDRGPCQFRDLCNRGCPFSGYFSSNSATLPAAEKTGNLSMITDTIVSEIIYDPKNNRAKGVRVIDAITGAENEYFSKVIFLNASAIATASILLNSTSSTFPDGFGNTSGQIGHNLMDHFLIAGAEGEYEGFEDNYYYGRNPGCIYIPQFRNINEETRQKDFIRGYAFQGKAVRLSGIDAAKQSDGFGAEFKEKISKPGPWRLWIGAWGETLPYYSNRIKLDPDQKDRWGLPLVSVHYEYHENEQIMREDIKATSREMLENSGFKRVKNFDYDRPGGSAVHEMGTARMGADPRESVVNENNQMHDVKNVFITDGSFMTSSACQNPSLTYMAFTARACDFAINEIKKLNL